MKTTLKLFFILFLFGNVAISQNEKTGQGIRLRPRRENAGNGKTLTPFQGLV